MCASHEDIATNHLEGGVSPTHNPNKLLPNGVDVEMFALNGLLPIRFSSHSVVLPVTPCFRKKRCLLPAEQLPAQQIIPKGSELALRRYWTIYPS